PVGERRGRGGLGKREAHRLHALVQLGGLATAAGAALQMSLEVLHAVRREHAERVLRELVARLDAGHRSIPRRIAIRLCSASALRNLMSAARSRVFTVPRGMPSLSAISRAVQPEK